MGRWWLRGGAVALLCLSAATTWHFGTQFAKHLAKEREAVSSVPPADLGELQGQTRVDEGSMPIHLVNTTVWHLTAVTLALDTADSRQPMSAQITQRFDVSPWSPGGIDANLVRVASDWNRRLVHYHVIFAEGFE
jgi:hypothetical protein